jgi:glycerol-3-phosphate dehydrogenase
LENVKSVDDLGEHFGAGLYEREVEYLVRNEWARTAEDVLFRRSKLGLHVRQDDAARLRRHMGG